MGKISVFITFGLGVHCSETTHIPNHSKSTSKTNNTYVLPKKLCKRSRLHVNIQPKPIQKSTDLPNLQLRPHLLFISGLHHQLRHPPQRFGAAAQLPGVPEAAERRPRAAAAQRSGGGGRQRGQQLLGPSQGDDGWGNLQIARYIQLDIVDSYMYIIYIIG